jgi:SAM-dependent methyltransferase
MNGEGERSLRDFLASSASRPFFDDRSIVPSRFLSASETGELLTDPGVVSLVTDIDCQAFAEHEAAPFPSYPHEWPPEMLHAAGALTIRLALALVRDGIGIKDATPSNVMFWGPQPVFLDLLSFEKRDPYDPTWLPYAQFVRSFLLPLMANRLVGMPLSQIFITRRDGLEPDEVYPLLSPLERLYPRSFGLVTFPVWFGKRGGENEKIYQPKLLKNAEQADFILTSILRRQERLLRRWAPEASRVSTWSDYMEGNNNYSSEQGGAKLRFVKETLSQKRPAEVLDIGCNTGVFSLLAAEAGSRVVAVDYDPVVVGRLWRVATEKKAAVLPLVVNLARPTPAIGWLNRECRSFLDRAEGAFDCVLMLALIHHLLVTERIPLPQILETASRLTRRSVIVEYVGPTDSMFKRLTRGREHLHRDLTPQLFESVVRRYFRIVRTEVLAGAGRRLYLLEKTA